MKSAAEEVGVSREQFREAVASTVGSVHHFYREVARLYTALREAIQSEPDPFMALGGYAAKASNDPDRTLVRNWFGQLFEPNMAGEEEFDEERDGDDDDESEDAGGTKKRAPAELYPDRPVLIVKLKLFDPLQREAFEPALQYAVIGDWGWGSPHRKPKEGEPILLARYMLRRVVKAFDAAGAHEGLRITTRAMVKGKQGGAKSVDRQVSFKIVGTPQSVPLHGLDSAESVEEVGRSIQRHWREVLARGADAPNK